MEERIKNVIKEYYSNVVKNNLEYLDIFKSEELKSLINIFNNDVFNDEDFKNIEKNINTLKILSKTKTDKAVNLLLSDDLFSFVSKDNYQKNPIYTEANNNLFLRKTLYNILIQLIYKRCKYTNFLVRKSKKKTFFSSQKTIEEKLKKYQNIFLSTYSLLKNKYDNTGDYIHPLLNNNKKKIIFTKLDYCLSGNLDKIKMQLDDMSKENIGKIYSREDILRLEEMFENKKINKLIAKKEIKLGNNFTKLINDILKENTEDAKKYFAKLFEVTENKYLTNEDLYSIYQKETNKEAFLKYLTEKTVMTIIPKNNFEETEKIVSIVDNLFEKIVKSNYEYNSLNLKNDDIKFILMLETLNSIKTSNIGNKSNITLNVYKDISSAEINGKKIKINS